ncbi:MAG TPA: hydantoinase B/oxoprolinase family protein [Phototrophicaceae bacterium]|nr:hydantoinase B/oxoprolinase family protein [Phototrophicaceae bacterium]
MQTIAFDPIRLEMLWSRLLSIADEMAVTLTRTAFSPIVRDAHDYGCSVFDAEGNLIAIGEDATPGLSVSAMVSVKNMLDVYPADTLRPGDVLITNDPWLATGHLLDLTIVTPVFYQGQLAAFAAAVAHHMDIGGRKTTPDSREVYEEGLFIPVLKLYDAGQPNETLFRMIASNVRVPDMVVGDVHAQVAANALGGQRVCELLAENGWSNLNDLGAEVLARAEQAMRTVIGRIPDGTYHGELTIDGFEQDLHLVATVTVKDTDLTIDFAGTSPQVDRGINCVYPITEGLVLLGLQLALQPNTPTNAGLMRALSILVPSGSLLAAEYPAPVVGRSLVLDHIQPTIFMALADAIPDQICAVSGGPVWSERFYGHHANGRFFFVLQLLNGGQGARPTLDGVSGVSFPNNVATIPTELLEEDVPLLIERKGLLIDSGGAGRTRGGLAQEFRVRILDDVANKITLSVRADRTRNAAPGLFGGRPGRLGRVVLNGSQPVSPKQPVAVGPGDVVAWELAGGGGYGDCLERDPERVLADVRSRLVSIEAAKDVYGVVIVGEHPAYVIDLEATNALRQRLMRAVKES